MQPFTFWILVRLDITSFIDSNFVMMACRPGPLPRNGAQAVSEQGRH